MKRLLIGLVALGLAGCSTSPNNLRNSKPIAKVNSSKNAQQFIGCIVSEWNEIERINPLTVQPSKNGFESHMADPFRGTVLLLDVNNVKDGSEATLYQSRAFTVYESALNKCK